MPRALAVASCVLMWSCHADVRPRRCNAYRTPRVVETNAIPKGEEKSAHAPWILGDCWACHLRPAPGEARTAGMQGRVIRPSNERCVSCHQELFAKPPRGHPSARAFCTSCHDPHVSRLKALLRDEDTTRACLDYAPPVREPAPRPKIARPGPCFRDAL
jgi:predicted CXXCH cytochrome family protein